MKDFFRREEDISHFSFLRSYPTTLVRKQILVSETMTELLVDFLGKVTLPDNSHERAMNQLACHLFLISLSGVNFIYLFFIGYLGTGSVKKNFLQFLAMLGALMQIGSCYCSIWRYNIGDEYHFAIGNAGALFGLLSGVFNNCALSTIWIHGDPNRKKKWTVICSIIFFISAFAMYKELVTYEETHFFWFRIVNMQNVPYTGITCYYTYRALSNGKLKISPKIIEHEDVTRCFQVLWIFLLVAFFANLTGITLTIYIGGGLCFGCVNIATYYMGLMDDYYDSPFEGETTPLLPS